MLQHMTFPPNDPDRDDDDGAADFGLSWVRAANGYGTWKDKPVAERGWALDTLTALGIRVEQLVSTPKGKDPPDCTELLDGESAGIEVKELVDERLLKRAIASLKQSSSVLPAYRWWERATFQAELQAIIDKKDRKPWLSGSNAQRVLVIHTSEFTLTSDRVSDFLQGAQFRSRQFTDVVLGLQYEPISDLIPAFRLSLEKKGF